MTMRIMISFICLAFLTICFVGSWAVNRWYKNSDDAETYLIVLRVLAVVLTLTGALALLGFPGEPRNRHSPYYSKTELREQACPEGWFIQRHAFSSNQFFCIRNSAPVLTADHGAIMRQ